MEKILLITNKCPMCRYEWDSQIIDSLITINFKNNELEYREREKYFNEAMTNIRNQLYDILKLNKHKKFDSYLSNDGFIPLLSINPKNKQYRFNCYCFDCPCNKDGLCVSCFNYIPKDILHEFDGDNIVKNFCG